MKPASSTIMCLVTALLLISSPAAQAAPLLQKTDLFAAGTAGYVTYRVPGLLVTARGTVLATVEARRGHSGDWDDNDVLLRRSTDGGRTWDPPRLVAAQKTYGPGPISNFVLLNDRTGGAVHALYCHKYARVFYMRSEDDGVTFSAPVEITAALEGFRRDYPWRVIAMGPGHGTQLRNGRFIVPVWMSDGSGKEMGKGNLGHRPSVVSSVYSDDHGATWHCGAIICRTDEHFRNPSETIMVELADGRVLFNIRSECKENRRLVSISPDGIRGWSEPRFEPALLEPVCMASLIRQSWPEQGAPGRILFANPDNLENKLTKPGGNLAHDRKRLTVKMSTDECRTWAVSQVLEEGPSGYSDLGILPDGSVLCIYECGMLQNMTTSQGVVIAHFNLDWLSCKPGSMVLGESIKLNGLAIDLQTPPKGLVVRPALGLLTAAALDGQVVHHARPPLGDLFETRATITPGGDYLLMFPEGQHYGGSKGKKVNELIAYRSSDHGLSWQGPSVPLKIDYSQHGFIPLIPRGSRRIYAFGTQPIGGSYDWQHGQQENAPIGFRWSDDDGRTWSDVRLIRPVNDPDYKGMSVMRMCETPSGVWLLGTHEGDWSIKPLRTRQYILRSEDQGQTWTLLPGKRPDGWFAQGFDRMDEGRPIALGGAEVLLMSRTPQGHLFTAWSTDDGRTWTKPAPSPLVHPDAPPMLFHLSDGKTLVAFHHNRHAQTTYAGLTAKMEGMKDRSEIWVATSTDQGHTWSEPRFLLANAAAPNRRDSWYNYQCSYMDGFVDAGVWHLFMPHRWQDALHLTIKEAALATLPTKAELAKEIRP